MNRIRVLIADDHPLITEGFSSVLGQNYPDIRVVATVSDGRTAVTETERLRPDVVLLDVKMPHLDGISAMREIAKRHRESKVIILTTYNDRDYIRSAVEEGAVGFVLKDTPISDVVLAIRAVDRGSVVFPNDVLEMLSPAQNSPKVPVSSHTSKVLPSHPVLRELSPREREVLQLLARGLTNAEIASELAISDGTVRNYVHKIYEILGVHNRTAVVLWAFDNDIR